MTTPSATIRCRLCVKTCKESLTLYYENEQINENVLQVASKYFRLEFLTRLQDTRLWFMCLECWKNISEFDNFHTMVSLVQDLLCHHGVTQVAQIPPDDIQRTNDKTNIGAMAGNPSLCNDELQIMDIEDTVMISSDEECAIATKTTTRSTSNQSTNQDRDQPPSSRSSTDNENQSDLEEYDDPVGVFTDAQFDNEPKRAAEAIETNSHNDNEMPEFSKKSASHSNESKTIISGSNKSKTPKPSRYTTKWDKNLNCPLCKKTASRFHFLNEHFRYMHPDEKCYVECCGNKYFQRHDLEDHMKKVHVNANALDSATTTTTPQIMEDSDITTKRTSPNQVIAMPQSMEDNDITTKRIRPNQLIAMPQSMENIDVITKRNSPKPLTEKYSSEHDISLLSEEENVEAESRKQMNNTRKSLEHTEASQNTSFVYATTRIPIHIIDAKWKRDLECPLCHKLFPNFSYIDDHFQLCHPGENCYVECCGRRFFQRAILIDHIAAHIDPTELISRTRRQEALKENIRNTIPQSNDNHDRTSTSKSPNPMRDDNSGENNISLLSDDDEGEDEGAQSRTHINKSQNSFEPNVTSQNASSVIGKTQTLDHIAVHIDSTELASRTRREEAINENTIVALDSPTTTTIAQSKENKDITTTRKSPKPVREEYSSEHDISLLSEEENKEAERRKKMKKPRKSLEHNKASRNTSSIYVKTRTPIHVLDSAIAKWKKDLECPLCQKLFPNFAYLGGHFKLCHQAETCHVKCCERRFYLRSKLLDHIVVHIDPKELVSPTLRGEAVKENTIVSLDSHTATAKTYTINDFKDSSSSSSSKSKKRTRTSSNDLDCDIAKWRENLECYICKAALSNFTYLNEHFEQKHPGETTYVMCCERKFPNRFQLIKHIVHHLDANSFQCEKCGKRCNSTFSLKGHKLRRHNM